MDCNRTIRDIAETLRQARERERRCSLLIGAGCSVKAGVPATAEFARQIKKRWPRAYERAVAAKPDDHKALYNWGITLSNRTDLSGRAAKDRLLADARSKCEAANALKPGSASYNLACFAALTGDEDGVRKYLDDAQNHGMLPGRKHLESDLDSVRNKDWFKELLEGLG